MAQIIPETGPDFDETRIIERPDGFYWQSKIDEKEYGPFPTLLEAEQDMQYHEGEDDLPLELEEVSLEEAESEIGITDWIDQDTGEPGEEGFPRLEDH
jgi:hypothetical protein